MTGHILLRLNSTSINDKLVVQIVNISLSDIGGNIAQRINVTEQTFGWLVNGVAENFIPTINAKIP